MDKDKILDLYHKALEKTIISIPNYYLTDSYITSSLFNKLKDFKVPVLQAGYNVVETFFKAGLINSFYNDSKNIIYLGNLLNKHGVEYNFKCRDNTCDNSIRSLSTYTYLIPVYVNPFIQNNHLLILDEVESCNFSYKVIDFYDC